MKNDKNLLEFLNNNLNYEYDNYNFLSFLDKINFTLDIPFIHVTGTNGKTTLSKLLYYVYLENNYKVGLFSFNEFNLTNSININGKTKNIEELQGIYDEYYKLINKFNLNSYEVLFFISLVLFKKEKLDLVIIDTYMGGEYDFTNIDESPILAIINNVELEHSDILGRSKSEIAYTKGGIIKPDSQVLINILDEDCEFAIKEIAKKYKINVHKVNEYYNYDVKDEKLHVSYFPFKELVFNNAGLYNRYNIACLLEALLILKDKYIYNEDLIQKGINRFNEVGYYNIFNINNKKIILDNAHNPASLEVLGKTLAYTINEDIKGIVAVDNSKNIEKMLGIIQKRVSKLYLTTYDDINARDRDGFILFLDDYEYFDSYEEIYDKLMNDEETRYIIFTGSEKFIFQVYNKLFKK